MSDNIIEIYDSEKHSIEINTSLDTNNSVIIELLNNSNNLIDIINNTTVLVSDLPQGYPLDWTIGNLPVSRVSGLSGSNGVQYSNGNISLSGIPSNLLPVVDIDAGNGILISKNNGIFNVSVTGQFGLTGEEVDDRVSALLIPGSYINLNYDNPNNQLTISVSGLQPSGDYAPSIHNHSVEQITDFNSAVSGVVPIQNISAGNGISVSNIDRNFLIAVTGQFGLTGEEVDNRVSNLLEAGTGINLNYNNDNNLLTINTSGLQPSGDYSVVGHSHNASDIIDFNLEVSGLLPNTYYAAAPWTINHTLIDGTRYLAGDLVYSNGRLYKANYDNESLPVSNTLYWTDIGDGYRLNIDGRDIQNIPYPVKSVNGETGDITIVSADITDFNSSVSGLLPSVSGSEFINTILNNNIYIISATGLQPSGNYALLTSPSFLGTPTAPTAPSGTNTTQIASTAFVRTEISNLIGTAPSTLDTLNELASALGNDVNFSSTVTNALANKANLNGAVFTGSVVIPSGSGNFNNLTINGTQVSISGHNHYTSDILDFNTGVSGLLTVKSIDSGEFINISNNNGSYIISATGIQPSGNYSVIGHNHSSIDIIDLFSTVTGIVNSGVSTSLIAGTGISLNYYSATDNLIISTSGVSLVGHKHVSSEINDLIDSIKLVKLNDLAVPTGSVNVNNQRITNLATAVAGTDAINKNYIDNLLASTTVKGIANFSSSDFEVINGLVNIKISGIDNNQLAYNSITLGSSILTLGSSYNTIRGVIIDGGSP